MEQSIKELNIRNYLWLNSGLKFLYLYKKKNYKVKNSLLEQLKTFGFPPYKFILTYFSLYEDIENFSEDNNPRIKLFKNILRNLKWRSGYLFIPFTMKGKDSVKEMPQIFWEKVKELKKNHNITHILIFGRDAQKILLPSLKSPLPYFVKKFDSYTILVLPSPEDMLPDNRKMKNITWNFLQHLKKT